MHPQSTFLILSCETQIAELHSHIPIQEHVFKFEIPVHDSMPVKIADRDDELAKHPPCFQFEYPSALHQIVE